MHYTETLADCMSPETAPVPVIAVAIVEDQRETREGLSLLINNAKNFECRHVYASMEAALEGIGANPPSVALVDIGLPGMSGIDGVRILRERHPSIRMTNGFFKPFAPGRADTFSRKHRRNVFWRQCAR